MTFSGVAETAGVSQSYLYAHADIAKEIRSHQTTGRAAKLRPSEEQTTAASLRVKLQVAILKLRDVEVQLAQARSENHALLSELVELRRKQKRRASEPH